MLKCWTAEKRWMVLWGLDSGTISIYVAYSKEGWEQNQCLQIQIMAQSVSLLKSNGQPHIVSYCWVDWQAVFSIWLNSFSAIGKVAQPEPLPQKTSLYRIYSVSDSGLEFCTWKDDCILLHASCLVKVAKWGTTLRETQSMSIIF